MNIPPPLPVRALEYDTQASRDPWPVAMRGIGVMLIIVGAGEVLYHGSMLVSHFMRWSDPYYIRGGYFTPTLSYLLMLGAMALCAGGLVEIVGGIGCAIRGPWARWTLLTSAVLEIAGRLTSIGAWSWYYHTARARVGVDEATLVISQLGSAMMAVGLPVVVMLLVKQRGLWGTQVG